MLASVFVKVLVKMHAVFIEFIEITHVFLYLDVLLLVNSENVQQYSNNVARSVFCARNKYVFGTNSVREGGDREGEEPLL